LIGDEELKQDSNATEFFHALSNLVPAMFYNQFTSDEKVNILEFNHIANHLIFQYKK